MKPSPCAKCDKSESCSDMCYKWRYWFNERWNEIRTEAEKQKEEECTKQDF